MATGEIKEPYQNFRFLVEIDGILQAGFSEVVMPETYVEVIEYREGNDISGVRKVPGRVHYGNLILKWGATDSHELYNWWKAILDGVTQRRNLSIILLDEKRNKSKKWYIRNAWPIRFKPSNLAAQGNEVAIEMMELTHEGMELIP